MVKEKNDKTGISPCNESVSSTASKVDRLLFSGLCHCALILSAVHLFTCEKYKLVDIRQHRLFALIRKIASKVFDTTSLTMFLAFFDPLSYFGQATLLYERFNIGTNRRQRVPKIISA